MANIKKTVSWILAYVVIAFLVYFLKLGGVYYDFLTGALSIITPCIPLYFGFKAYRFFGKNSLQGKSAALLTVTMALFLLGDISWLLSGYAVISIADIFWLTADVVFIVALYISLMVVNRNFFREGKNIAVIGLAFIVVALTYAFLFSGAWETSAGLIEKIVTDGYVVADLILVFFTVLLLYASYLVRAGTYYKFWLAMSLGNILLLFGDQEYASDYLTYFAGNPSDLLWLLSYASYAMAFILLLSNASTIMDMAHGIAEKHHAKRTKSKSRKKR